MFIKSTALAKENVIATSLTTLAAYKTWADHLFFEAVANLPDIELRRNRPMLYDSIFNLLSHTYHMDVVWASHIQGQHHHFQTRNPDNSFSFDELRSKQAALNKWLLAYADNLALEDYSEAVNFTFIGGGNGTMTRSEIIQHIVNHGSYHRGHIEGVFYQLHVEPPTTDLPVFLKQRNELI